MTAKKWILFSLCTMLLPVFLLTSCKEKAEKKETATVQQKQQTYTCSMHPQIVRNEPGNCPICGMELVPFDKDNVSSSLTLGADQVALANITTVTIGEGSIENYKYLSGRLVTDPAQTAYISGRVAGRIELLNVKETGVQVTKGQALYSIYSEELASLQQEYLLTVAQVKQFPGDVKFEQIEKAARQKLLLYNQTEAQLQQLVQSQKVNALVTYYAPVSGTVAALSVTQGQYIAAGGDIMKVESYGELWVEADVYPAEAGSIHVGQQVQVIIPGWETHPQTMTIKFINPAYQPGSQLLQVRGTIANPGNQWQPGLQANILLPVKNDTKGLRLPIDAVIRSGKNAHVWVETGKGVFEPRTVMTGTENAEMIEIIEGIDAGDKVVITGAYLLYSEFILKKGSDPVAEHHH
ncbi:MAG: efflux RND transporter periplasmic adaptor subunit [Chitinophagaceae bacterium]